jgi:hypothetical protein
MTDPSAASSSSGRSSVIIRIGVPVALLLAVGVWWTYRQGSDSPQLPDMVAAQGTGGPFGDLRLPALASAPVSSMSSLDFITKVGKPYSDLDTVLGEPALRRAMPGNDQVVECLWYSALSTDGMQDERSRTVHGYAQLSAPLTSVSTVRRVTVIGSAGRVLHTEPSSMAVPLVLSIPASPGGAP